MPAKAQRLIYKARPLADGTKLSDYITANGEMIHLVAIPGQSGPPATGMPPGMGANMPPGMGGQNPMAMVQQMMQNMQSSGVNPMEMLGQMGMNGAGGAGGANPMQMMQQMMGGMPPAGGAGMPQVRP